MRINIIFNAHNRVSMDRETIRVGQELRAAISEANVSQWDLARLEGVTQSRISRVLSGEFTPKSKLAQRLCDRYGVEPPDAHISEADRAFQTVTGSLRQLWDGTPKGAHRLRELLGAVRTIRLPQKHAQDPGKAGAARK
jgi:transcriptional regulator with XRE-family HTH domain